MPNYKHDHGLDYHYRQIDMHCIEYQKLLDRNTPDAIVLAILCDFNRDSTHKAVTQIVQNLHDKLHKNPKKFREYLYMMEILSDNRHLKKFIKEAEAVITQVNIKNLPSYELGMEQGMEQGIEQGIEKIVKQLLEKIPRKLLPS